MSAGSRVAWSTKERKGHCKIFMQEGIVSVHMLAAHELHFQLCIMHIARARVQCSVIAEPLAALSAASVTVLSLFCTRPSAALSDRMPSWPPDRMGEASLSRARLSQVGAGSEERVRSFLGPGSLPVQLMRIGT